MSQSILVVAAHPDDEVLGCGATIAKHAAQGDNVHILILGEGATSRAGARSRTAFKQVLSKLKTSAERAADLLGAQSVTLLDLPDNRFDSVDLLDVVKRVEAMVEKHRPSMVYTHHSGDVNIDHRVTHEAVVAACRPIPGHPVDTLLFFEVASSTEWQTPDFKRPFTPDWFVDVSETAEKKIAALKAYASEMRPWPHSRSYEAILHQMGWRGATVGAKAAEAFVLGRCVVRGR